MSCVSLSAVDARRLYDQAAVLAKVGAFECKLATQQLSWTDGVYDIFGVKRGTAPQRTATVELYEDESRHQMERLRAEAIATCGSFVMEAKIHAADGVRRIMRLSAQVAQENGRITRLYGAKQDITHEKDMWENLRRLAFSDPLTGLANRRAFEDLCEDVHRREHDPVAVSALVVFDVDNFKQINDQYGHSAGDECLRQIAIRLGETLDSALMIARLGGDEFAALLRVPHGRTYLELTLDHTRRILSCPVFWNGVAIEIGVSIGTTILRRAHRAQPEALFAEADSALYLAKASGRNQVRFFAEALTPTAQAASALGR